MRMFVYILQDYRDKGRSNGVSMLWDITDYLWYKTVILKPLYEELKDLKGLAFLKRLVFSFSLLKDGWHQHFVSVSGSVESPNSPIVTGESGSAPAASDSSQDRAQKEAPMDQSFLLRLVCEKKMPEVEGVARGLGTWQGE